MFGEDESTFMVPFVAQLTRARMEMPRESFCVFTQASGRRKLKPK